MTDIFSFIFSQTFLIRALVVGVLISLCCALLGVSLVLKRFSMIGDGLSHVGFGALSVACMANIAPLYFSLPVVIIAAFFLLRLNENGKIKGDAAIALLSTGALAFGVMVMSVSGGMNVDVYNYMFGSILTMTDGDVALSIVLSIAVIIIFVLFYNEIFAVTFDENFAKATGTKTNIYNTLIAVLTAVTIVIGMRIIGTLLISSLIIFPTVISMRISKSYKSVVVLSAVLSVIGFLTGLVVSVRFETPAGASVVCVNIVLLIIFTVAGKILSSKAGSFVSRFKIPLTVSVFVLFFAAFVLLIGTGDPIEKKNDKPSIVTTNFASYDLTKEVTAEKAEITMLLRPGEESHTFEPSPADIQKIINCDIFVYTGGESDSWVEKMLSSVDASKITFLKMMDITGAELETITEGMAAQEQEEYDEHVWTSPLNAIKISKAICEAVCKKDRINKDFYNTNLDNFINQIQLLDKNFKQLESESKGRPFVIGDRFPLKYLFDEYNFEYYAAFPGCSAETEADPVTLSFLINKVKDEKIPVVFKTDNSTGNAANMIGKATGAKVMTLYSCQSVTLDDFENGETYLSLMEKNYTNLKAALS